MTLKDVSVEAQAYHQKVICKDGMFDVMNKRVWLLQEDAQVTAVDGLGVLCGEICVKQAAVCASLRRKVS